MIVIFLFLYFFYYTIKLMTKRERIIKWWKRNLLSILKIGIHTHTFILAFFLLMLVSDSILMYIGRSENMFYLNIIKNIMNTNWIITVSAMIITIMALIVCYVLPFKIVFKTYMRFCTGISSKEGRVYYVEGGGFDKKLKTWCGKDTERILIWFSMHWFNIFLPLRSLYTLRQIEEQDAEILYKILSEKSTGKAENIEEARKIIKDWLENGLESERISAESNGLFMKDIMENGRRFRVPNSKLDFIIIPESMLEVTMELPDIAGAEKHYKDSLVQEVADKKQASKGDPDVIKDQIKLTSVSVADGVVACLDESWKIRQKAIKEKKIRDLKKEKKESKK